VKAGTAIAAACAVALTACLVSGCVKMPPGTVATRAAADGERIPPVPPRPGTPADLTGLDLPLYPGIDTHATSVTRTDDARGHAITLVAWTHDEFLRVVGWYANRLGRGFMFRRTAFAGSPIAAFTISREHGNAGVVLWSRKDPKTGGPAVQITLLATTKR
jgi:hypothetical protein